MSFLTIIEEAGFTTPEWAAPIIAAFISIFTSSVVNALFKHGVTLAKDTAIASLNSLVAENKLSVETSSKVINLMNETEANLLAKVDELTATIKEQDGIIAKFVEGAATQSAMVDKVLGFMNEYDDEIAEVAVTFLTETAGA